MPSAPARPYHRQSLWANPSSLLLSLAFAAFAVAFHALFMTPWLEARAARLRGGWARESMDEESSIRHGGCDFLRLDAAVLDTDTFEHLYRGQRPVVLSSSTSLAAFWNQPRWPFVQEEKEVQMEAWGRDRLLKRHGKNLTVLVGGWEAWEGQTKAGMFALGNGVGGVRLPLQEFVHRYLDRPGGAAGGDAGAEEAVKDFAHTGTVSWALEDLPRDLADAVCTPKLFDAWAGEEMTWSGRKGQGEEASRNGKDNGKEEAGRVRIALGKSRGGRGWSVSERESWSGLMFGGAVLHYLYPPGRGLRNLTLQGRGHPLLGPLEWATGTLGVLEHYDGVRGPGGGIMDPPPLQCWQGPGDLVYVPPGWKSMRVHVGDVVMVEGEGVRGGGVRARGGEKEDVEDRIFHYHAEALARHPEDVESLIAAGEAYARQSLRATTTVNRDSLWRESFMCVHTAVNLRPCDPTTHLVAAQVLLANRSASHDENHRQAKAIIHRAEETFFTLSSPSCPFPDLPRERVAALLASARLRFAQFFLWIGDETEAKRAVAEVLALRPTYLEAHQLLVLVLKKSGRDREAREAMHLALIALGPRGRERSVIEAFESLLEPQKDCR